VALGFVYTMALTTYAVVGLRKAQGQLVPLKVGASKKSSAKPAATKSYTDGDVKFFLKGSLILGAASVFATKTDNPYAGPIQTLFLFFASVAAFVWSANLPTGFVKIFHPLLTSSGIVLALLHALAAVIDVPFLDVLKTYRQKTLNPMETGAGDIMMYLLGPSVVSFAVSMYSRRDLIRTNFLVVLTAMIMSSAGSMYATAAFVRLINLGGPDGWLIRLSVLGRNVTTALSMAMTAILGGDISIAASVVAMTGILGGTYGKPMLNLMGVTDPISRGLGIGGAAQGLGVAAMYDEPTAFPFSAVSESDVEECLYLINIFSNPCSFFD